MTNYTPEQRRAAGRKGGYAKAARYGPDELTGAARAAFDKKFLDEVDPDRVLPEKERNRRAEAARKAFYVGLSIAASKAKREAKTKKNAAVPARATTSEGSDAAG